MIRTQDKSRRYSIAMLLVYVPMVLLSSLHIHHIKPVAQVACGHCIEQIAHQAHLSPLQVTDTDECLLCRFLWTEAMTASVVSLIMACLIVAIAPCVVSKVVEVKPIVHESRGPPCW